MINRVILMGRLVADPELKTITAIATQRRTTDMIDIKACKCGYTPYIDHGYYRSGKLYHFCKCPNCKTKGRDADTEQQAIKYWNNGLQRRTA